MSEPADRLDSNLTEPPVLWPVHKEPMSPDPGPLMIMTAPVGGQITRAQNPHLPYSPREIADESIAGLSEGSQIAHLHVRDELGFGSDDQARYEEAYGYIKEQHPDALISLNMTRPLADDRISSRFDNHDITLGDSIVVNLGSMNIGDKVFANSWAFVRDACKYADERGVKPEMAVYNERMIIEMNERLIEPGHVTAPYFVNLCIGIHNGATADIGSLQRMVALLPEDAVWMVSVGGRNWLPLIAQAIVMGGHVRVGMEDNVHFYRHSNQLINSSRECVRKAVQLADVFGRKVGSVQEVSNLLGLSRLPGRIGTDV